MSLDPRTVTVDELEGPAVSGAPSRRIVGRYDRAVVVETDLSVTQLRFTVWALADIDTGPYDKPVSFSGMSETWAHQVAAEWTRLG